MEAVSELLTLKTDYAAKIDADLELVEKDRERVRTEITALQDQLRTLESNHALLLSIRKALSGHSPAAGSEPKPRDAAATGSSSPASTVSDGTAHTVGGAASDGPPQERQESERKPPTLRDLVAGELRRRGEHCSSHDVATALARAHPGRRIKEPAMRHALEALVAQGRVGRAKRGSRVFYFSAGPSGAARSAGNDGAGKG